MASIHMRSLTDGESALLEEATLGNVNWCGERFTMVDVRGRPEFSHYTRLVRQRGDFGIVAERDEKTIGVVWALFLPRNDPGYGFIDDVTPEVSLWVGASVRGHGVGRTLIKALLAEASLREVPQVSLSVEAENYAKGLYESEGFLDVPGSEADGIMIRRLG